MAVVYFPDLIFPFPRLHCRFISNQNRFCSDCYWLCLYFSFHSEKHKYENTTAEINCNGSIVGRVFLTANFSSRIQLRSQRLKLKTCAVDSRWKLQLCQILYTVRGHPFNFVCFNKQTKTLISPSPKKWV